MESNNIDDFFRQHSHKMDEVPDDALWQKIEAELPVGKLSNTAAKSGWFTKMLLLSAGILGIGVGAYFFTNKAVKEKVTPTKAAPKATITAPEITADTVKPKKIIARKEKQQPSKPKQSYIAFRSIDKQKRDTMNRLSSNTPQPAFKIIRQNAAPATTKEPVKITVQFNKKRTVITINEKVSQKVFDSITQAKMEQYKNNSGMQLIIKEPRSGNIFRTTFETKMVSYMLISTDTLKSSNKLSPETIQFKTDTLKTIAPAGVMTRYYVKSTNEEKTTEEQKKQP